MDYSLTESSVHGIFQARILEWVAISFSRKSSQPSDGIQVSCIVGRRFTLWAICKAEIETPTQRTKVWIPRGERQGWGWTGRLDWLLCISQLSQWVRADHSTGNLLCALWWPQWEGSPKRHVCLQRGHVCLCGWFTSLCRRNWHLRVNPLYFNKN